MRKLTSREKTYIIVLGVFLCLAGQCTLRESMREGSPEVVIPRILMAVVLGIAVYLIPTAIAFYRKNPKRQAILFINVALRWTFIAYLVVLIWAFIDLPEEERVRTQAPPPLPAPSPSTMLANLEKLQQLRDSGTLTEEEFLDQKRRLLL